MSYLKVDRTTQIYNPLMSKTSQITKNSISKDERLLMLLTWEMNFINVKVKYSEKTTIVYIGENMKDIYDEDNNEVICDYGRNISILAELYEFITFHVFDFEEFSDFYMPELKNKRNVVFYGRNITEEDMNLLIDEPNLYVISNYTNIEVRKEQIINRIKFLTEMNLDSTEENEELFKTYKLKENQRMFDLKENTALEDLEENKRIISRLNPIESLVKFRIPHKIVNSLEYMTGIMLLPIFSGYKSLETRLIVVNPNLSVVWNFSEVREIINYWNTNERQQFAINPFTKTTLGIPKFDNGMEVCIFFSIIKDYFLTMDVEIAQQDAVDFFMGVIEK